MPSIKKGESEDKYVARCTPIVAKEKGIPFDEAAARCHGMYKEHKEKGTQYETEIKTYTFECNVQEFSLQSVLIESKDGPIEDKDWIKVRAVAVVGDRMMRNAFVPYETLKKSLNLWNGTLHDINHMGTSYPDTNYPFKRQNIEYIIGYQDNAEANDTTKEISMDVNVSKNSPKYAAWKSFCDINAKAGKMPNVSMSISAKFKRMKVRDMQMSEIEYAHIAGFDDDDIVEYLIEIYPKALTTCIQGVCNDKSGCGIAQKIESEEDCDCKGNCDIPDSKNEKTNDGVVSDEDAKYLNSLKSKTQKLREDKYVAQLNEKIKKIKGEK